MRKLTRISIWILALLAFFSYSEIRAQGELYIFGVVKDYADGKKLENVKITAYQAGAKVDEYTTSGNGKYEFFLELGQEYELSFNRPGWVSKKVYMDSRNIPEEDIGAGFSMNIEMSLFEEVEGLDIKILEQPIGKAKYNPNTGAIEFDFEYTQKIKDELNRLMSDWEKGAKDKLAEKEAKEKELQELEKEFTKLVENADKAFLDEKYQESVADYKEALKLKPDNPMVINKLKNAEEKLQEQSASRLEEEKYESALKAGDDLMRTEEFEKAISKYEEALGIKPNEEYPKEQIADATAQLEAKRKEEENREKFEEFVRKGDALVKAMDYQAGIDKYKAALDIKPEDKDVSDKISAAEKALADYEANKAKKAEYDDLVAAADLKYSDEEFEEAIAVYEEALEIFPDEQHPKDRIAKARERIEEIKKQEEEERLAQERDAQFDQLVAAGDEKVAANEFEDGIASFEEALELKPDDQSVQKKISDAQNAMAALAAEEETNEKYNAAIEKGDAARESEDYQNAIEQFENASGLKPEEEYPKTQIEEINNLLAEQERIAEEKRLAEEQRKAEEKKLAEEMAEFNGLVESGDQYFSEKEYQKAIDQYTAALKIKPENQHLPNKIKEAEKLLAQIREKQDLEQNYAEAIEEGDQKFKGRNYEGAIQAFERAASLKPDETYPPEQLAAIQKAIEDEEKRREEEALAAQKAEEEARRQQEEEEANQQREEFNRIIKLGDELMAEKEYSNARTRYSEALEVIPDDPNGLEKLAEADRLLNEMLKNRDLDKQYNMIIADADAAYNAGDYSNAQTSYSEALEVKPDEEYPQQRISEIEEILAEERRKAELQAQAELEAEQKRKREEEELRQMSEAEKEQAALDEEYNTLIEVADRKMESGEFDISLRNYKEALALKPAEFYPKAKIQEIELLQQEEEDRRLEEERLAELERERSQAKSNKKRSGNSVDSQTEDEAERFMREARLREEAEKYERIKRLKDEHESEIQEARDQESERSSQYLTQVESFKQHSDEIHKTASEAQKESSNRMKNYKAAVEKEAEKNREKEGNQIDRALTQVKQYREQTEKMNSEGEEFRQESVAEVDQQFIDQYEYIKKLKEQEINRSSRAMQEVNDTRETNQERINSFDQRQKKVTAEVMRNKDEQKELLSQRNTKEQERIKEQKQKIADLKETESKRSALYEKSHESKVEDVQSQKQREAERTEQYNRLAELRAQKARDDLSALQATAPKDYDNYYLSKLAEEFPQGVTEQSDNVGNKVIIRRIVVVGNKADEFRKVIDKTGKYYFKNGSSITELTWNRETNPQMD